MTIDIVERNRRPPPVAGPPVAVTLRRVSEDANLGPEPGAELDRHIHLGRHPRRHGAQRRKDGKRQQDSNAHTVLLSWNDATPVRTNRTPTPDARVPAMLSDPRSRNGRADPRRAVMVLRTASRVCPR